MVKNDGFPVMFLLSEISHISQKKPMKSPILPGLVRPSRAAIGRGGLSARQPGAKVRGPCGRLSPRVGGLMMADAIWKYWDQ